jgi:riboflavin transporter FmnP
MKKRYSVKKIVLLALLVAMAYVLVCLIRIPVVMFLSYEPKDVIVTIGGFLLGPMASMIVSLLVSLLEMVSISQTGPVGCIMNFLSTCSFACIAALVYKKRHTLSGAVLGLLLGSAAMVLVMLLWNWLITPLYMGVEREAVEAMLIPMFLPFNLLKAGLNSALTLGLYKPLVTALRKIGIVEAPEHAVPKSKTGIFLLSVILLATCILLLLVFQGKI